MRNLNEMTRQELLENLKNTAQERYIHILKALSGKYTPDAETSEALRYDESDLLMLSELIYELDHEDDKDGHPFIEIYILDNPFMETHGNYEFYSDEGYDTPENNEYIRKILIKVTEHFDDVFLPDAADIENIGNVIQNSLERALYEEIR